MKTTLIMRNIANPRRTTLAHLQDADELTTDELTTRAFAEEAESQGGLPAQTANPERVVFEDAATRVPASNLSRLDD